MMEGEKNVHFQIVVSASISFKSMQIIWNALEIPFEGVIPPDSKWAIMFIKVEIFKHLCLILCLPPAGKFCFRPQLRENF